MKDNGRSVAKQVEAAKRQLESWPEWMRKAGRFEGADVGDSDRHIRSGSVEAATKDSVSSGSEKK